MFQAYASVYMVKWQEFYIRLNAILKIRLWLKLQYKIIVISC